MTGVLQMLFIIAIIAVVVLVFVVFIWQQAGRHIKKYLQGRLSKWLLIGYVTVLIVSIGLSFMIPVDQASGDKRDEADFYRSQDELYQLITAGSIEEIDPAYIEGRWEKDMALDQLQIESDHHHVNAFVLIDHGLDRENHMEAILFQGQANIGGVDVSEKIKPLNIEWSGDTLSISNPDSVELEFAEFDKAFTIRQFSGEDWLEQRSGTYIGDQILYLRLPQTVHVVNRSGLHIQYVQQN